MCVRVFFHWVVHPSAGIIFKMSSQTSNLQQSYDAEKHLVQSLEEMITRLGTKLDQAHQEQDRRGYEFLKSEYDLATNQLAALKVFALLPFHWEWTTQPAAQDSKSTDGRQLSPSLLQAQPPVATSTASSSAGLQTQGSASKSTLHASEEDLTQSRSLLNSSATSVSGPSRSMAQVAVDPPRPQLSSSVKFLQSIGEKSKPNPQAEKIVESQKSPAEREMLRLEKRRTLHVLTPYRKSL